MKQLSYIALAAAVLLCWTGQFYRVDAQGPSEQHSAHQQHVFTADSTPWGAPPPVLAPGAQFAIIEGDPTAASGNYTIRLKLPDGYRIAPHWHPLRENVTILAGTLKVGMGDAFDASQLTALPAGSFAYLDPDMHHYAMAAGAAIVQVHGQAPLQFNYVNPQDDPSRK